MADEIELKLALTPEAATKIEVSGLLTGDPDRFRQVSIYYDTPDHTLSSAGLSLRIRKSGRKRVQTIKAAGTSATGLFARSEWERPVSNDIPVLDEGTPLPALLAGTVDTVAPVFEVTIDRRRWMVSEGEATIEVVIDRGEVVSGERQSSICELELELKSGDPAGLFAFAREIDMVAPVRLGVLTKAERGYRLAGPAPAMFKAEPVVLEEDMSAARAFQQIVGSNIRQFRLNEALLLADGGSGALHQARVALRRLRSALSIFGSMIGEDGVGHGADLRWLTCELGEARDLDVLMAGTRPGALHDRIAAARDAARDRVSDVLSLPRTRRLMLDLAEWIAVGDWSGSVGNVTDGQMPVGAFAVTALDRFHHKVKKKGRDLADVDDCTRHEVRKVAKKLRYAAEFFKSLFEGKRERRRCARFIAALETLQDQLGALNDLATAAVVLEKLGVASDPDATRLLAEGRKKCLVKAAGDAHGRLLDAKRFWR